jgi:hypothetical protein
MLREKLGLAFYDLGRMGLERVGDLRMQLLPGVAQQAAMRRVLHQCMLKTVDGLGQQAALEDQLGSDELAKCRLQLVLGKAGYRAHQHVRKLASNRCADLRHMPHRPEAVQPRQQRGVQGCRDRQRLQRAVEHVAIVLLAQQPALQDALG